MIKYLRLRKRFDARKMEEEMRRLEAVRWKAHYNQAHYSGEWTVLPLRSLGGSLDNIISVHAPAQGAGGYQDTELLENCPYVQSVLDYFQCEKTSVRFMKLEAGALIREHRDQEMSFEEGEARLHLPVATNPDVEFYVEDERILMQPDECWYLNLSLRHRVFNGGTLPRVHLVMDCLVNDWLREIFDQQADSAKQVEAAADGRPSKEDQVKIIAELKRMNTPASLALAATMEQEGKI
ncbi:MAG: aspartyl/asparaginyl beta-hydroxylase domain-containing protein [Flavisolibacter sp.]